MSRPRMILFIHLIATQQIKYCNILQDSIIKQLIIYRIPYNFYLILNLSA